MFVVNTKINICSQKSEQKKKSVLILFFNVQTSFPYILFYSFLIFSGLINHIRTIPINAMTLRYVKTMK